MNAKPRPPKKAPKPPYLKIWQGKPNGPMTHGSYFWMTSCSTGDWYPSH